jgi:hypothetical protein
MVIAARAGRPDIVTAAAALFALAAVVVAVVSNRPVLRRQRSEIWSPVAAHVAALRQSSVLAAICYAWGAAAMQGLYLTRLTGLKWQHGWQYALAMLLLAGASIWFARSLARMAQASAPTGDEPQVRWAVPLAAAQACVAGAGLVALAVSGKMVSVRADWAANRVFVGLAVAILAISLGSILGQRRYRGDAPALL